MEKKHSKNSSKIKPVLVLDCGTTGVKALVFHGDKVISRDYLPLKKIVRKGIRKQVEQDPKEILKASLKVLKNAVKKSGNMAQDISGLGITNQRETTIVWERKSGKPIYPAIVWEDDRTLLAAHKVMRKYGQKVLYKTGLRPDAYFSATKIAYILDKIKGARERAEKGELAFGTVDSWMIWNLLEGNLHLTDQTNASRTLLFNVREMKWDHELMSIFNIPESILPKVLPSYSQFGNLKKDITGGSIPLLAVCGDQESSLFAAGTSLGTTKITFGTGAFIAQSAGGKFMIHPPFFTTLAPSSGKKRYMLEAKVDDCGQRIAPLIGKDKLMRKEVSKIITKLKPYILKLPVRPLKVVVDGGVIQYEPLVDIHKEITGIKAVRQVIFDGTALGVARIMYKHGR